MVETPAGCGRGLAELTKCVRTDEGFDSNFLDWAKDQRHAILRLLYVYPKSLNTPLVSQMGLKVKTCPESGFEISG